MAAPFIALIFADAALKGSREPPAQRLVRFTLHRLNTGRASTRARLGGFSLLHARSVRRCRYHTRAATRWM